MKVDSKGLGLSETIEVLVLNNTAIKYNFPDNQTNLDNALVHAIALSSSNGYYSIKGKPLLDQVEIKKGFLTLSDIANKNYNALLPMVMFLNYGSPIVYIKPRKFNVRNSYIELPQINLYGAIPAGGAVVLITFFYTNYDSSKHRLNSIGELENDNY